MQSAFGQFVPAFVGILVAFLAIYGGANPWLIAAALVFFATMVPFAFIEGKPADRQRLLGWIDRRDNLFAYDALVGLIDRTVTRMLAPRTVEEEPQLTGRLARVFWWITPPRARDSGARQCLGQWPFAWPVMEAALKIAVVYPPLLLLLQWAITNAPTGIGDTRPLQPAHWGVRLSVTGPLVLLVGVRIAQSAGWKGVTETLSSRRIAYGLFFVSAAGAVAAAGAVITAGATPDAVPSAGAIAVLGSALAAGTSAMAGAIAAAGAVITAVIFAIEIKFLGVGELALALTSVFALGLAVTGAVAAAVEHDRAALGYTSLLLTCIATVSLALAFGAGQTPPEFLIIAFAIGVLPVVNAVFDYLSYGITLTLLRAGRREGGWPPLASGIIDAIAAALILYGLALTLCLILGAINALGAVPLLPLDRLFADLADPAIRGGYAWLYLTLLSTLVPTGVHLVLALISVTTLLPQKAKRWFIDRITNETSDLATLTGVVGFALFIAVSLVGLVWIGWHGALWIMAHFDDSALLLLSAVESTVRWLGIG